MMKIKIISIIALILFLILSIYMVSYHSLYYPSIDDLLSNPEKFHNKLVEQYGVVSDKIEGSFYINWGNEKIKVISNETGITKYGYTTVYGIFKKEGYIQALKLHHHNYNNLKYLVSILAGLIFIYLFFKEWKIIKGGFKRKCRIG